MSITVRADPIIEYSADRPSPNLAVNVFPEGDSCVIHTTGELDLATRNQLFMATTAGNHPTMVIDLTRLTFMDCSGYGCLAACRLVIEGGGRTLVIRGQTGQPARLLDMIAQHERIEETRNSRTRQDAANGTRYRGEAAPGEDAPAHTTSSTRSPR